MRNGRSILFLAIGLFLAWFIEPAWQWYLDRALDAAARPHGVAAMIAAIAPVHPLLLGVSIGMILALVIGYWRSIKSGVLNTPKKIEARWRKWFPRSERMTRGAVSFEWNEREKVLKFPPKAIHGAREIRTEPYSNVFGNVWNEGQINFRRTDLPPKTVWFEILY